MAEPPKPPASPDGRPDELGARPDKLDEPWMLVGVTYEITNMRAIHVLLGPYVPEVGEPFSTSDADAAPPPPLPIEWNPGHLHGDGEGNWKHCE